MISIKIREVKIEWRRVEKRALGSKEEARIGSARTRGMRDAQFARGKKHGGVKCGHISTRLKQSEISSRTSGLRCSHVTPALVTPWRMSSTWGVRSTPATWHASSSGPVRRGSGSRKGTKAARAPAGGGVRERAERRREVARERRVAVWAARKLFSWTICGDVGIENYTWKRNKCMPLKVE
jgi:hypothetical protein